MPAIPTKAEEGQLWLQANHWDSLPAFSAPLNMYYVRTCQQQGQPGSPRESRGHEQCRIRELVFTLLQSPSCHPGKTALNQSHFLEETVAQSWEDPCWKLQSSSLLACLGRKPKMGRVLGLQYLHERPGWEIDITIAIFSLLFCNYAIQIIIIKKNL